MRRFDETSERAMIGQGTSMIEADLEKERLATNALRYKRMAADPLLYISKNVASGGFLPCCQRQEIALLEYSPLRHEEFPSPWSVGGRVPALSAERHGRTPRPVALNFLTRHPAFSPSPRPLGPSTQGENAGSVRWELTEEDFARALRLR